MSPNSYPLRLCGSHVESNSSNSTFELDSHAPYVGKLFSLYSHSTQPCCVKLYSESIKVFHSLGKKLSYLFNGGLYDKVCAIRDVQLGQFNSGISLNWP